jgi:hypothetical protein
MDEKKAQDFHSRREREDRPVSIEVRLMLLD